MSFSRVSVLVPTRGRPERLKILCESFAQMSGPDAEMLFRIDRDDEVSFDVLKQFDHPILVGDRYDGYRSLPRFFDELRQAATGDVFLTGNDDMVFRTPQWDAKILGVANQYPDGVFCLGVETHNAKNFPFAIVSKPWVEAIGHIHDQRLFWGDIYLRDIAEHFGRALRVHGVQIDHDWAGFSPDRTFTDANQMDGRNHGHGYNRLHLACVYEAIQKLEAACLLVNS